MLYYCVFEAPTMKCTPICLCTQVLTNCRTLGLFKEVIRGEHVKFELIQVSSDFRGTVLSTL